MMTAFVPAPPRGAFVPPQSPFETATALLAGMADTADPMADLAAIERAVSRAGSAYRRAHDAARKLADAVARFRARPDAPPVALNALERAVKDAKRREAAAADAMHRTAAILADAACAACARPDVDALAVQKRFPLALDCDAEDMMAGNGAAIRAACVEHDAARQAAAAALADLGAC